MVSDACGSHCARRSPLGGMVLRWFRDYYYFFVCDMGRWFEDRSLGGLLGHYQRFSVLSAFFLSTPARGWIGWKVMRVCAGKNNKKRTVKTAEQDKKKRKKRETELQSVLMCVLACV